MSTFHPSILRLVRPAVASASACRPAPFVRLLARPSFRTKCLSTADRSTLDDLDKQLNPRELIERKRRAFEEKYGDKLRRKVEAEGVQDLDALKRKVLAPSVKASSKATRSQAAPSVTTNQASEAVPQAMTRQPAARARETQVQAEGDRAGVKPLSSILNLPLLHLTPHDSAAISKIWTTYHTTHPTLSSSYLSASLSTSTYLSMLALAQANPFFVLPLPRDTSDSADVSSGKVKTDEYDMYYLQWLFHPTPSSGSPPSPDAHPAPLPQTTSVIFTPLEEYKKSGEWAQPYLVLTHYPDLTRSHDLVLMRGEISAAAAGGPAGSMANPGFLLSQQQAQLLALALQRFYCAGMGPRGESERGRSERDRRRDALISLRERPGEWDWKGLVEMAYGGMV